GPHTLARFDASGQAIETSTAAPRFPEEHRLPLPPAPPSAGAPFQPTLFQKPTCYGHVFIGFSALAGRILPYRRGTRFTDVIGTRKASSHCWTSIMPSAPCASMYLLIELPYQGNVPLNSEAGFGTCSYILRTACMSWLKKVRKCKCSRQKARRVS